MLGGLGTRLGTLGAGLSTGGGSGAGLAARGDIFVNVGNSYDAFQTNNDCAALSFFYADCPGTWPLHGRHARGGDSIRDAIGRWSQIAALRPKVIQLMNPQNSLAAGLAQMQTDYNDILTLARAAGVLKIVVQTQPKITGSNETLRGQINAWLKDVFSLQPEIVVSDIASVVDISAAGFHNGAGDHPNARAAHLIAKCNGAAIASCYSGGKTGNIAVALPGNLNADFNMPDSNADGLSDGWALTNAYTGATVTTEMDFFRAPGKTAIRCQVLRVAGTSAIDPATAGNELRLLKTISLPTATAMTGKSYTMQLWVEISDAAGTGAPVNLAAFSLTTGNSVFSNKSYTAANGPWTLDAGPLRQMMQAMPVVQAAQNVNQQMIVSARPMKDVAADYEIRFGWVNLIEGEAVAYGPPCDQSEILPIGKTAIFVGPAFSGTLTSGSVLSFTRPGNISGGGFQPPATQYGGGTNYALNSFMVRSPYGLPGDVAGNIEGARPSGAAAVGFTIQAGDIGQKLKMGVQAENAMGSLIVYSPESVTVT